MQVICLIVLLLIEMTSGKSDFDALLELKRGFKQDPSGKVLNSWNSNTLGSDGCPKDWYGITCSDGKVMSLTLSDVGLVGDFQFSAIMSLNMLQNISVSNNQLSGNLTGIGSLGALEVLDLSRNLFRWSIPSDLSNLKSLVLLNLSSNNFEGTFPSGLENLEKLKSIDLRLNMFVGDVMHLVSQLGSVDFVDLSCNQFSGSLDLGVANASFISSIRYLNLSHNLLVGELFPHDGMPFFDSLEVFDASNNKFVGTIPSFNFVVSLRILRLGSNQLSGSFPEALLQESSMVLYELDLSLNQIEGPIGIITSTTLRVLNMSSNNLSGPLPIRIGHCAIIDLSNNNLSGNMSRIQGWGNYVETIHLSSNSLTGNFPNLTSQFLRLTTLKLANNSMEGALPPALGTYPELEVIDLSLNQFTGPLLLSFFTSSRLTDLNLSGNSFTGPIPLQASTTQNLTLRSLDLSDNSLVGTLPAEFSTFDGLLYLNLENNHFQGQIPNDLPDGLKGFNVSYNNLSGIVPENLWRFPDSAFHPGNSLLILPNQTSPPKDGSNLPLEEQGNRMKPSIRTILIAGLLATAVIIALMSIITYYRAQLGECRKKSLNNNKGKKSIQKGASSPHTNKGMDSSPASFSFPQVQLSPGRTSVVEKLPKDSDPHDSPTKDGEISSPISFVSSTNPSPSKNRSFMESPGSLKVSSPDKLAGDLHLFDSSLVFTSEDLSHAPVELIGRSCHGSLYKASLGCGHILAVKWLREGIAKGKKEFAREAKKLGSIKHPNLVSFKGYYWGPKEHEKLILSNFIDVPCLALHLSGTEPQKLPPLSLNERFKVAVDVARCLSYLHNEISIPHGNLKSTNILVEPPNANALLTDYSLHRLMTSTGTAEQVLNAGALGYRPPEFASSSKPLPSLKSDVYAFGVILLELLTGKSSADIFPVDSGVVDLTDWVRLLVGENRSIECFDRLIPGFENLEQPPRGLDEMLQVALKCILPAPERPDMRQVFEDLSLIVL
ncbi:Serine-threonine/tyrosine-protein kinase, catalytic domain [Dillenia turbinata]|uniref:Serine-threonine/tyrosine-protein kinase, catalytic domain n=1 Tax=Dillenia turbinata TaxID=194707 RepID=A0AAN8VV07_9MAGN